MGIAIGIGISIASGGAGSWNRQPKTPDNYIKLGFGGLVCWNMPTFTNQDVAAGDLAIDTFAPTDLDVNQWIAAIKASGMKYAALTVKHHDGLCLWPTAWAEPAHSPYSIAQTTWYINNGSPDITKLFIDACVANKIVPCIYYSIWDLTHEIRSGTDETTDAAAYIAMIKSQLTELLTNYGDIGALWFDGWGWHISFTDIPYADIYNHIKSVSPNTLVINNSQDHILATSEVIVYEYAGPGDPNTIPSENVKPIRRETKWFYSVEKDITQLGYDYCKEIRDSIASLNALACNYFLGLTIDKSGHIPTAEKRILDHLKDVTPDGDCSGLFVAYTSATKINFNWLNGSINEDGISIERRVSGGTWSELATVIYGVQNYSDTTVEADEDYEYRVRAFIGTSYSAYSNILAVTAEATAIGYLDKPLGTEYAFVTDNGALDFLALPFTFAIWIKGGAQVGNSDIFYIAGKAIAASVNGRYTFVTNTNNGIISQGVHGFGGYKAIDSIVSLQDGVWHFCLMEIDINNNSRFYIDDVEIGSFQSSGKGLALANAFKFYIGTGNNADGSDVAYISKLSYSRAIIYHEVLTADEKTALMNSEIKGSFIEYWPLDAYPLLGKKGLNLTGVNLSAANILTTATLP